MTTLSPDVHSALSQLLSAAKADARDGDIETATALVDSVESVAANKVPDSTLRGQLLHGCSEVEAILADEPDVAVEYLRSMGRRVEAAEQY